MCKKVVISVVSLVLCFASLVNAEEGLATYYRFDEGSGTALNDISGNGNNGTKTGDNWAPSVYGTMKASNWMPGVYGYALSFNGTSDCAVTARSYSFGTGDLSVSLWFKTPNNSQDGCLLAEGAGLTGSQGLAFILASAHHWEGSDPGHINFLFRGGGPPQPVYLLKYSINNNVWYHVVGVREGKYLKLYVNGTLQASTSNTDDASVIDLNQYDSPIFLGSNACWGEKTYFNGTIDEVRIYKRALSADEVKAVYTVSTSATPEDNKTNNLAVKSTPLELGMNKEIWITVRTDGKHGTGTIDDPFDGSTQAKFDGIMNGLWKSGAKNTTIHLGVGTFETVGSYVYAAYDPTPGWRADDGWKFYGAGMGNTIVKLAGYTYLDPGLADVTVSGGVWATKSDNWFQVSQEIRLAEGKDLAGLELGKVYYVSEVVDAKKFKVSALLGGATIDNAAIGSAGQYNVINKNSGNTAIGNNPWNKQDVEVRDLTVDCNWTGFGTALTAPFTVPGEMQTVTVDVESSAWAQVNKWVYIQQLDYTPVGVYEVVSIPNGKQIVLRNLMHTSLPAPAPGQSDLRFGDNLPPGKSVAKGTRVCPRINLCGVSISAPRAKVERVRVTNVGTPIYESPCGIFVVGIGQPGPDWPDASEIVIRDCIVDNIWGQYGMPIGIAGNNVDWPSKASKGYGTQGLVEGNTIYGNGLYQGLTGWNFVNSVWINNKVINCAFPFFIDSGHTWNNIIKNNMFLECKSYTMVIGGRGGMWSQDKEYKTGNMVVWDNLYYTCKAANTGQTPPNDAYWEKTPNQELTGWNSYIIENNIIEICDNTGPLLFSGGVANTIFRNNILRYAPGHGRGSSGLEFSEPTNRGLIVTGNVIDSRLKNNVGKSVVFGKDNVDEKGRIRQELEIGERVAGEVAAPAGQPRSDLSPLMPASAFKQPEKPGVPLVADLGPEGEILNWLVLGPFPHPPQTQTDGSTLGAGYGFDFLSSLGGEAKVRPQSGASMEIRFPEGSDAVNYWDDSLLTLRRLAWQRTKINSDVLNVKRVPDIGESLDNTCVYAACVLKTEKDLPVLLKLGSDDGYVLFVNGRKVGEIRDDRRGYGRDANTHNVMLRSGENVVIFKVCNAKGGFEFGMRVTDPNGLPPKGIKVVLP